MEDASTTTNYSIANEDSRDDLQGGILLPRARVDMQGIILERHDVAWITLLNQHHTDAGVIANDLWVPNS